MFGYVKPEKGELKVKEYELYKCAYCGLCHTLHGKLGCLANLTLSYDFVFLALFSSMLNDEKIETEKRRCVVHPFKAIPVVKTNESFTLTARVSAALTYYKIKDDISDSSFFPGLAKRLILPYVSHMKKRAGMSTDEEEEIKKGLELLARKEKENCSSPDEMAEIFGGVLSSVFVRTVNGDREKKLAAACGMMLGKWIYLIDAIDDYEKDKKKKEYNPFLLTEMLSDEELKQVLILTIKDMEGIMLFSEKPDGERKNIVENIVYLGLPAQADKTIEKYSENNNSEKEKKDEHRVFHGT